MFSFCMHLKQKTIVRRRNHIKFDLYWRVNGYKIMLLFVLWTFCFSLSLYCCFFFSIFRIDLKRSWKANGTTKCLVSGIEIDVDSGRAWDHKQNDFIFIRPLCHFIFDATLNTILCDDGADDITDCCNKYSH